MVGRSRNSPPDDDWCGKISMKSLGETKQRMKRKGCLIVAKEAMRDLSIEDTTIGPRLTVAEKTRLLNCDRPCAREEWRVIPPKAK